MTFPRLRLRDEVASLLDLPWEVPLADWDDPRHRFRDLPVGPSRNLVRFLVHEGIGDRGSWDPHWDAFCDHFTTVRFDQRGFGESADPTGPYALHEDALTVMRAAGFERAAVVGVSLGGAVAIERAKAAASFSTFLLISLSI